MKIIVKKSSGFRGKIPIPGDKSISHRAAFIASLASGTSEITNFLYCRDCLATLNCLQKLGVEAENKGKILTIKGKNLFGFKEPSDILNTANSGSTARLLLALLSGQKFFSIVQGDSSLRKRPMRRVVEPLRMMGARIEGRKNGSNLPLAILGNHLTAIKYKTPIPSAQLKSSILLAGLLSQGKTEIEEFLPSRDHTERMLGYFGAGIEKNRNKILIKGRTKLQSQKIIIPGDFSSASFFMAAAICVPNSEVTFSNIGLNPTRTGFLRALKKMGAKVTIQEKKIINNEPLGIILTSSSSLKGIVISPQEIPGIIDEIPLIAILATQASGKTIVSGASELRVKESDRLKAISLNLKKMGVAIEEKKDGFVIEGPQELKGASVQSHGDHRIAMALAIAGLIAEGNTEIEDFEICDVSFPNFYTFLQKWQNG
ncbi:MAG: 3-phosphoshikimate 1-carboxyvinyltransferase [Candidatus Aminicenantales bacterium]